MDLFATYQSQEKGSIPDAIVSGAMGHVSVGLTIDPYQNIADNS